MFQINKYQLSRVFLRGAGVWGLVVKPRVRTRCSKR